MNQFFGISTRFSMRAGSPHRSSTRPPRRDKEREVGRTERSTRHKPQMGGPRPTAAADAWRPAVSDDGNFVQKYPTARTVILSDRATSRERKNCELTTRESSRAKEPKTRLRLTRAKVVGNGRRWDLSVEPAAEQPLRGLPWKRPLPVVASFCIHLFFSFKDTTTFS